MLSYPGCHVKPVRTLVVLGSKNPSLMITVWHHSASLSIPKGDPWDGFFFNALTLMVDSYNLFGQSYQCFVVPCLKSIVVKLASCKRVSHVEAHFMLARLSFQHCICCFKLPPCAIPYHLFTFTLQNKPTKLWWNDPF